MDSRSHPVEWTAEKVAGFWDYLAAHDAGEFFSDKHAYDIAERLSHTGRPRNVVDIGCGTGQLVAELSRRGVEAVGVDSSPHVLETARRRAPTVAFHMGSVTRIPLPDASCDAATLIEVVEHLDDQTLQEAIREAHRILRPGGTLLITTPNAEDLAASMRKCPDCGAEFHLYQHVRSWTAAALRDYLEANGFTVRIQRLRFVERAPLPERVLRRIWYGLTRQQPRLLALATKPAAG